MDRPVEFFVLWVDAHDGDAGEDELRPPPLADGRALRQRELHRHCPARAGHAVIAGAGCRPPEQVGLTPKTRYLQCRMQLQF